MLGQWLEEGVRNGQSGHESKLAQRPLAHRTQPGNRLAPSRDYDLLSTLDTGQEFREPCLGILHIDLFGHVDQVYLTRPTGPRVLDQIGPTKISLTSPA